MHHKSKFLAIPLGLITLLCLTSFALAHGMSEAEKATAIEGGNLQYIWLGATHMLTGYDHLAFVFGIIFFLTSFKDIAKYVTAFTIGHSITLVYATFNGIQLNYYLIDAIIALSVCYIAFHNLDGFRKFLNINPPNMMAMIFGLGLIHGFGLSTILQELPLDKDNLLANIISFNIGIELGQIAALALMLVFISLWRKSSLFPIISRVINIALIIAGAALFVMQMQGYLSASSGNKQAQQQTETKEANWQDEIKITVPANSGIEYKLQAKKDAKFTYSWQTDSAALYFDFHGEPKGDTTGYFKSYKISTENKFAGSIDTPFEGTHGWYWKNTSNAPVVVTLKIKGEYTRMDK